MELSDIIISAGITVFSLSLVIIAFLSYRKYQNPKLWMIGTVFVFFFLRGILLSLSLFNTDIRAITSSSYIWVFDLAILVLLYITSLKR